MRHALPDDGQKVNPPRADYRGLAVIFPHEHAFAQRLHETVAHLA
jgi:hypothetical protein